MPSKETIKVQKSIRHTNKLMSKLFAVEGEKDRFTNWLKDTDCPILKTLNISIEEFVPKAEETNKIYDFYFDVQPITFFMRIKAEIYEEYLNTQEKRKAKMPNNYF